MWCCDLCFSYVPEYLVFLSTVAYFTRRLLLCPLLMVFYISCVGSGKFASKIFKSLKSKKISTREGFLLAFVVGNLVLLQAMWTDE